MTERPSERLYNLLPSIYRQRDAAQGEPLRALLAVLENELLRIEADIDGMYENWFIETCEEWAVPYIGELLGIENLSEETYGLFSHRALVANILSYRRRKGTLTVIERVLRDMTGWKARIVEYFNLLSTTQNLNHLRPDKGRTFDIRNTAVLKGVGTPFETLTHTVEVGRIASHRGRYNLNNVGLFLWRLQSYALTGCQPRPAAKLGDGCYTVHPLGYNTPLFNRPQTEAESTRITEAVNVPGPISQEAFITDQKEYQNRYSPAAPEHRPANSSYYGPGRNLYLLKDGEPIPPINIIGADLNNWARPQAGKVAVDVSLGRITFAEGEATSQSLIAVNYNYGFSSDIGSGPYKRALADQRLAAWVKRVAQRDPNADFNSLADALRAWADPDDGNTANAVITIADNSTYVEEIDLQPADDGWLVIQAGDGNRPLLRFTASQSNKPYLKVSGGNSPNASLTLNGLLIEGGVNLLDNSLGQLRVTHCTLMPGREPDEDLSLPSGADFASIRVEGPNKSLSLEIDYSIVGALRLPEEMVSLSVRDSIIDSPPARSHTPALVSGYLGAFPTLSSSSPAVNVTIGDQGPYPAILSSVPTSLSQGRDLLQEAIRAAHSSPAFTGASVIIPGRRLVILPGVPGAVTIEAAEGVLTAAELRLDNASARKVYALVTKPLSPFPMLTSSTPEMNVTIGGEGPYPAELSSVPTTVAQARDALQEALRTAHSAPAFTSALVGDIDDQLVILPGEEGTSVTFSAHPTDQTTVWELGLERDSPAIASSEGEGLPGPPATLERTTIFGRVYVREISRASDVIFTAPVIVRRQQRGAIRYSYVPEGSKTPWRYRCQPDLALRDVEEPVKRNLILTRLKTLFTAVEYGQPGYAQLSRACAQEIRAGGEDDSEMGVFNHLKQPQREAHLQAILDEHLRFGLEAGIFYVT